MPQVQSILSKNYAFYFLLIALTTIVYSNSLSGDYIFDDKHNILLSKAMQKEELTLDTLSGAAFSQNDTLNPRPLSRVTFFLNAHFFGLESAFSFKLTNLIIHILNGLIIFKILSLLIQLLPKEKQDLYNTKTVPQLFPALVAAIWLVHPINISGAIYIVQRMASMAALFTLLGIWLYLAAKMRYRSGLSCRPILFCLIPIFTLLAILCKENGILLIAYCAAIEIFFPEKNWKNWRNPFSQFVFLFFLLPAIGALFIIIVKFDYFISGYTYRDFTMEQRLLTQPRVLFFYLQQIILPLSGNLSLHHDHYAISNSLIEPLSTVAAITGIAALAALTFITRKSYPMIGLGLAIFFIGHSVESTFIALEMVFEHRNYFPSLGIIITILTLLFKLRKINNKIGASMLAIYPVFLAIIGYYQASLWGNTFLHIETMANNNPNSYRSVYELARLYAAVSSTKEESTFKRSVSYAHHAMTLDASGTSPHFLLMHLAQRLDYQVDKKVLLDLRYRLRHKPLRAQSCNSLFSISLNIDTVADKFSPDFLLDLLDQASMNEQAKPRQSSSTWFSKANIYSYLKDFSRTAEAIEKGLLITPKNHSYRALLVSMFLKEKYIEEAIPHYEYLKNSPFKYYGQKKLQYFEKLIAEAKANGS